MWESKREKVYLLYFSTCLGLIGNFMQRSPGKTQINYQVSIYLIGRVLSWTCAASEAVSGLGEGTLHPVSLCNISALEPEGGAHLLRQRMTC